MHVQNRLKAAQIKTKYVNWYQGYCPRNRVCSSSPKQNKTKKDYLIKERKSNTSGEKITEKLKNPESPLNIHNVQDTNQNYLT